MSATYHPPGPLNGHAVSPASEASPLSMRIATREDMPTVWPFVRTGLAKIKRRSGSHATWHPEHVRAQIYRAWNGQPDAYAAELWLGYNYNRLVAFAVTQLVMDNFINLPTTWLVWMAYHDPADYPAPITPYMNGELVKIARDRGYACLQAYTHRFAKKDNGYSLYDRLKPFGWQKVLEVLQLDLYEDEVKP